MFRAPSFGNMPHLQSIVDNIGYGQDQLARFLNLSPRTVRGYITEGQAPRPVMYALYWETSWGAGHANATNDARRYFSEALILRRQVEQLKSAVSLLEHVPDRRSGSANSPIFKIMRTVAAPSIPNEEKRPVLCPCTICCALKSTPSNGTMGVVCAKITSVGKLKEPAPYYSNPQVTADLYYASGKIMGCNIEISASDSYKTYRLIKKPSFTLRVKSTVRSELHFQLQGKTKSLLNRYSRGFLNGG